MPTPRQLEIFCAAAADCNFRDTADRLGMSQPAISSHIKALEQKVGRKLFTRRRGTTPILSDDGVRLLETARQALELSRELSSDGDRHSARQRVVVGIRHYLLETVVRSAIPRFVDAHPDIDLEVRVVDDVDEMGRMVRSGTLAVALFRGDPPADPGLIFRASKTSGCSIYAAVAMAQQIDRAGTPLDRAPFILLPENGRSSDWIVRRLIAVGIKPQDIVRRSQFPNVILEWVLGGRGIGVLFDATAQPFVRAGQLVRIGPPLAPVSTFFLAEAHATPAMIRVIDFLEEVLALD
jgi:DNA-binding transcriptional LysR family regulator